MAPRSGAAQRIAMSSMAITVIDFIRLNYRSSIALSFLETESFR